MSLFRRQRTDRDVPRDVGSGAPSSSPSPQFLPATERATGPKLYPDPVPESGLHATSDPVVVAEQAQRDAVDDPWVDPARPAGVEDPVPQVAPVSRSGRNMPVAAASGLTLLAVVLLAAWWHPVVF